MNLCERVRLNGTHCRHTASDTTNNPDKSRRFNYVIVCVRVCVYQNSGPVRLNVATEKRNSGSEHDNILPTKQIHCPHTSVWVKHLVQCRVYVCVCLKECI